MRLQDDREHPHGLSDAEFDAYFTADKPVIFAYHGYPWLIHRLTYRRTNHDNFHVRGYVEEGTTTTPFDICVMNRIDRYDLAIDVIDRVPRLRDVGAHARDRLRDQLIEHRQYVRTHGEDLPEIRDWQWTGASGPGHRRQRAAARARGMRVLVVNAGSSSLKLARLDDDGAVTAATTVEALAGGGAPGAARAPSSPTAGRSTRSGHRVVHGGPRHTGPARGRRRCWSATCTRSATSPRCTTRGRWPASAPCGDLLPDVPAVACFDTTFHATLPAAAAHLRGAAGVERAVGSAAVRLPRPLARLRRPPRRGARRPAGRGPADRHLPPRRRRLPRRRARRGLRGHHHGLHPAGRAGDEHPAGHPRPRPAAVAARARRRAARPSWATSWSTTPG